MPKPKKKKSGPTKSVHQSTGREVLLFLCGLLCLVTILAYMPIFWADFVNFDDHQYVVDNQRVLTGLTWDNIVWATKSVGYSANWHPLTWYSHMLDAQLFGTQAGWHHAVNVGLHAVNAVLLFLLLRWLTGGIYPSLVVATLFAIHPMNVESVAWISQRKTVLSTLFCILAIAAYARYTRQGNWWYYLGSLILFFLSLAAKPMMVTLPFALLLLDYWPLYRVAPDSSDKSLLGRIKAMLSGTLRLVPEKLPFLALSVFVSWLTLQAQEGAMSPMNKYPLGERLINVTVSYVEYLRMMIWPTRLAVFYPLYGTHLDNTVWKLTLSVLVLSCLTLLSLWFGQSRRYLLVGWLWYLGTLVPVIGLVHVGAQSLADRYVYIPFWGIWMAIVWLAWDWISPKMSQVAWMRGAMVSSLALLTILVGLTFRQVQKWSDTVTLFEDAAKKTQRNWLAHRLLAEHFLGLEDYTRANFHCGESEQWDVEDPRFLTTHGRALYELGSTDRAMEKLHRAIELRPDLAIARVNLGWVEMKSGRYSSAADQFEAAARLLTDTDPPYAWRTTYANWAAALAQDGRSVEALNRLQFALNLEPERADLLRLAAEIELQLKQYDRARERLQNVLQREPQDMQAYQILVRSFTLEDKLSEATAVLSRMIEIAPDHYVARGQLADLLVRQGNEAAAIQVLDAMVRDLGTNEHPQARKFLSQVHGQLAELHAKSKNVSEQLASLERAVEVWNENTQANQRLAWLLSTAADQKMRNSQRALELAQNVMKLAPSGDTHAPATLAAAYASTGQFAQARDFAQQALDRAQQAGDLARVETIQQQLKCYDLDQPYIEQTDQASEKPSQ